MLSLPSFLPDLPPKEPVDPPSPGGLRLSATNVLRTLETLRWVCRGLFAMSTLCAVLLLLLLLPRPEPGSLLVPIDGRMLFACIEDGCWHRVAIETSFAEVAQASGCDQDRLRAGNPQIVGDTIRRGAQIRISSSMWGTR